MSHFLLYIDPSSGNYIVQVIVAAVLGAGFVAKSWWWKIKSFFQRKKDES
ncbi:MAG: hypothetical protein JWP88_959 [Flaviaesturariibacter sp.]|nr:hypothetical protein [Flaviaesturariibacter sp.]